jgi:hypothetical protein
MVKPYTLTKDPTGRSINIGFPVPQVGKNVGRPTRMIVYRYALMMISMFLSRQRFRPKTGQ